MKTRVIKSLVLGVCFFAYSFNAVANDTIRFIWQANTVNAKDFFISATGNYTIDWGNGVINARSAGFFNSENYTYPTSGTYTVTIAADNANGHFTDLFFFPDLLISRLDVSNCNDMEILACSNNLLDTLDVSNKPLLIILDCSENNLKSLNVSGCTALDFLVCRDNQLSSLDIGSCTALTYLSCNDNILDSLDLSANTILEGIDCSNNQITSLNFGANATLERLSCSNNQLSSLNLANLPLTDLDCDTNHLPLSELYAASQKIAVQNDKILGFQTLSPQTVKIGDVLFANQSVFNSVYTSYAVMKNSAPASGSDYTVSNGTIVFNDTGYYNVTMTNAAIVSDISSPAKVMVDIAVTKILNTDATLADLSVSEGVLTPAFDSDTLHYTVNVASEIASIIITATPSDINAIITGDTGTQQLLVGANPFTVTVTAEDGITILNYLVTVNRAVPRSTDATLADLTVGDAELNPSFSSMHYNYIVCLESAMRSIMITATPNDSNATVVGDGQQQLSPDTNEIVITVTAEDGTTTLQYTVIVINGCGVGIEELSITNYELQVYPNPVNTELRIINYELRDDAVIEIFNIMGQCVGTGSARPHDKGGQTPPQQDGTVTIDVSHLAKGMYFLKVDGKVIKVIKE